MSHDTHKPNRDEENRSVIFQPLRFRSFTVKNRLFRSSISGQFDNYDGSGAPARFNWEERFAIGGVGTIISSFTPVSKRARILTRYAMIDNDDMIPFWAEVGRRVHQHDCRFLMQLSHSGRQQDVGGVENLYKRALSSTGRSDYFHGILCQPMTRKEIRETIEDFARGAKRAEQAGLDGVELHGANGYLITQFLSSSINDRNDEYGGPPEKRARFVIEVIRAIRERCPGFHLQMKINGVDHDDWLYPWRRKGNTLRDTIEICKLLEAEGVDAFHISSGSTFPHPRNPAGDFPVRDAIRWYDVMESSGRRTGLNSRIFTNRILGPLFRWWWNFRRRVAWEKIPGINAAYAREIKKHVKVPVLCAGGFQTATHIADAIRDGSCDGVTIARPLIRNPDLPHILQESDGPRPGKECTFCNRCLLNDLENPLGCYDVSRYDGATFEEKYDRMIKEVMSVFHWPRPFP